MLRCPPPEFIQVTRPQRILLILKPDGVFADHSPVSENEAILEASSILFWPAEPLSPIAGACQALYAPAETGSFQIRDRAENQYHRIREDPAGVEVWLRETAIDTGASQSVEMGEGFECAFVGEAIVASAEFSFEHNFLRLFIRRCLHGSREIIP